MKYVTDSGKVRNQGKALKLSEPKAGFVEKMAFVGDVQRGMIIILFFIWVDILVGLLR